MKLASSASSEIALDADITGDAQLNANSAAGPSSAARAIHPVSKDTIRTRVYGELKRALLSGVFEPGQVIIARVIAEQMGVGLMPVRESVQQLVTEGGLEFLPSRMVRVPNLTRNDLQEIFEIRMKLESMAAGKAAARMTPQRLAQVRRKAEEVVLPEEGASAAACLAANQAFHFTIYEIADAPHLYAAIERLWLKVGPLLILPYRAPADAKQNFFRTLTLHDELVERLAAADAEGAADRMQEILCRSLSWYLQNDPGSSASN